MMRTMRRWDDGTTGCDGTLTLALMPTLMQAGTSC